MLFDTHSHPQFSQYDSDREAVIKRAVDEEISLICVGTDYEKSVQAIELAHKFDGPPSPKGSGRGNIWASVGLHPNDYLNEVFNPEEYYQLGLDKKVVAVGEIGLDYYRTKNTDDQLFQKKRFIQQLELAAELSLPVIVHCRDAHLDMQATLKANLSKISKDGVIHSFTGNWADAKKYFELGFYIGLNGIITFTDQYNETIINAPLDRILLETDAPYLSPEPYRGKRNEPSYVKYVAQKIADLKNVSLAEVAITTTENARKLFKI